MSSIVSTKLVLTHADRNIYVTILHADTCRDYDSHYDLSRPHTETHTSSCCMFSVTHIQHILFTSTSVTQTRQLIQTLKHTNCLHNSQKNLQILPLSGRTKQNILAWKKRNHLIMKHDKNVQINCKNGLMNSRFHIEDVPHSHVGLSMLAVSLTNQLLFGPGHMDPVWSRRGLVVQNGMWLSVPVMNQLRLKEQDTHCLQQ